MTTSLRHYASAPTVADGNQIDYILLDGSGSMMDQWYDVLSAIDSYVADVRAANTATTIKLATFDSNDPHYLHRDVAIADWHPLNEDPIGAHFSRTPLYDAIAIMGRALRDLNPPRASVVIATDGDENASHSTDVVQARAIINWMKAKGWQVTFIGCNWNNEGLANRLGVEPAAAIGVERKRLSDAARNLASKRARYGATGEPIHFSDGEKQQFGGYLTSK